MSASSDLKVFATHPHTCSYLPDQQATTLFIDPDARINKALYSQLSDVGFRRSGAHLYRPHCSQCQACIPARVPVQRFQPSRQQRRIWQRNSDLAVSDVRSIRDDEYFDLYARYIAARHRDGDMYPADRKQFHTFLNRAWNLTHYYCFREQGVLRAVLVTDHLDNGLSAIYSFFDPDQARRSLGVYAVLWQIAHARDLGLDHLLLGYWIRGCRKMNYKTNYRPIELLIEGRWRAPGAL